MQPIARPRVVAPDGLEDDERPLQLGGDLDGPLQAEIGPRPACRRHPVKHEGSGWPNGSAVERAYSRIRRHESMRAGAIPLTNSSPMTLSNFAVAAVVVVWLETPRPI